MVFSRVDPSRSCESDASFRGAKSKLARMTGTAIPSLFPPLLSDHRSTSSDVLASLDRRSLGRSHRPLSLPFITIAFGLGIRVRSPFFDLERRHSLVPLYLPLADKFSLLLLFRQSTTSPSELKHRTSFRIIAGWVSFSSSSSSYRSSSAQSFVPSSFPLCFPPTIWLTILRALTPPLQIHWSPSSRRSKHVLKGKSIQNLVHPLLGVAILALGWATCWLGFDEWEKWSGLEAVSRGVKIAWGVLLGVSRRRALPSFLPFIFFSLDELTPLIRYSDLRPRVSSRSCSPTSPVRFSPSSSAATPPRREGIVLCSRARSSTSHFLALLQTLFH